MIIATVVLMIVLIFNVSIPLFRSAEVSSLSNFTPNAGDQTSLLVGIDDYREVAYEIRSPNSIVFYNAETGEVLDSQSISTPDGVEGASLLEARAWGSHHVSLRWSTGHVSGLRIRLVPAFDDDGVRTITYRVLNLGTVPAPFSSGASLAVGRMSEDDGNTVAFQQSPTRVEIVKVRPTENLLGEIEEELSTSGFDVSIDGELTVMTMDEQGRNLYLGTTSGFVGWWDISKSVAESIDIVRASDHPVTSLEMVYGDVSVAVGTEFGEVFTFSATMGASGTRDTLQKFHTVLKVDTPIEDIRASRRDKSLLILDKKGVLHSVHMTSERYLARVPGTHPINQFAVSTRGNSLITSDSNEVFTLWDLHKPHPETSMKTLFSKVWYERYDEPEYVWQSSSGSGDYEPKLSLMPLIYGSFKGTLYAMLFSVPLALLAALYTNQFLEAKFRAYVKSTVEIMASIPSVVIGFLVALWLAPIIEDYIVGLLVGLVVIPLTAVPFLFAGRWAEGTRIYRTIERGYEFLVAIPILLLGCMISYWIAPSIETMLFDGDFKLWLYESMGTRYDPRNAIIIAFGLGFVSIPIIFTISEDALSNLPQSLRAASLALGASRWQTAWRVVLPSASPGIFAAVIIGFGRVIGETMIVLMATGNTAIMDWGPFNGMRTLSANIAVEIPEAPVDGTLYRVLFLSAVLLFLLTFSLNTVAEIVRQRLRKKYGRFQ
jgi:phosphate transport system permease protein